MTVLLYCKDPVYNTHRDRQVKRRPRLEGVLRIIQATFIFYVSSTKANVVTPHWKSLDKMVLMTCHKIRFYAELWKIIQKLSLSGALAPF